MPPTIPDFLSGLFPKTSPPFEPNYWTSDLFNLMFNILNWDIVKGGLAFTLGLGIALFAVMKIRQAFGGG